MNSSLQDLPDFDRRACDMSWERARRYIQYFHTADTRLYTRQAAELAQMRRNQFYYDWDNRVWYHNQSPGRHPSGWEPIGNERGDPMTSRQLYAIIGNVMPEWARPWDYRH